MSGYQPSLPVQPTGYPAFWRTPRWRWWRALIGLAIGVAGMVLASIALTAAAIAFDLATGRMSVDEVSSLGLDHLTPSVFLANNLALAALIPVAFLISAAVFKQRPGFLASVVGRMRWRWLGRCVLIIGPIWLLYMGFDWVLTAREGGFDDLAVNSDSWLLVVGILITTPLQSAGEEYGFRGVINRLFASFFRNTTVGLLVGLIASSGAFMWAHSAADPWLNLYYFCFGAASCILVWRTGGLEASIVMHVVNNLLSMVFLPFSDISGLFDRSVGSAGPEVLIGIAVIVVATALIIWQADRKGIVAASAPAASMKPAAPQGYPQPGYPQPYFPAPGYPPVAQPGYPSVAQPGYLQPNYPQPNYPAPSPSSDPGRPAPAPGEPLRNPKPWESENRP